MHSVLLLQETSMSSENIQVRRSETSQNDRDINHTSVRAILRFSERFLPTNHRVHIILSHVGESTIVSGYFIGSRGAPQDATFLPLGVVAPDGTPFGLFSGPLPLADESLVVADSENPESLFTGLSDVDLAGLEEMGLRPV